MLTWALIFLVIALVAGFFGFRSVESVSLGIAKVLFFIFIVLFLITLIFGVIWVPTPVMVPTPAT